MPEWLNTDVLSNLTVLLLILVGVGALVAARFVQIVILKGVVVVLLAVLAIGIWLFRYDLGRCADDCDCTFAGRSISIGPDAGVECP